MMKRLLELPSGVMFQRKTQVKRFSLQTISHESTALGALTGARAKRELEMLLHKHFAQRLLHLSEIPKSQHYLLRGVVVAIVVATASAHGVATIILSAGL